MSASLEEKFSKFSRRERVMIPRSEGCDVRLASRAISP